MSDRLYRFARPFLHSLDPESAHRATIMALKSGFAGEVRIKPQPVLATSVWGIDFPTPVGLAAGFDKDAEVMDAMLGLGFGFVEAGTVTPRPQPGNPKPRLFRLDEDQGVINRFGFNSKGLDNFVGNLKTRRARKDVKGIVGANVGKNRDTTDAASDYATGIEAVCRHADYLVCNISSPNTPGLRSLQAREQIRDLIVRVLEARAKAAVGMEKVPPMLAKVGPDLNEQEMSDIAEVALETGIDGLIVGNTTIDRPDTLKSRYSKEAGGLSGPPLLAKATACLSRMYALTGGKLPIVGCGGIVSGQDAYAKIRAGASLVQVYSALVFHGPDLIRSITLDLGQCLRMDGFRSVAEAVGADHRSA
jgi:dihydroorotate dehydrogenase